MKYTDLKQKLLLTIAPLIASIAITVSYLPQLWLTFTTRNVEGQSVMFWILLVVALGGLTLQQYGLVKYNGVTNKSGLFTQGVNLLFATLMLIMVILFN